MRASQKRWPAATVGSCLAGGLLLADPVLFAVSGQVSQVTQAPQAFRAAADAVFTSVRVLDDRGRFVTDLRRDEFRIFEDDVEQTLNFFEPWIGGQRRDPPPAPTSIEASGVILPPTGPASDASGRIFIIYIDDLHLQSQDTPKVRHVLGLIRDTVIREGDLVGLASSGYSAIAVPLSYDYGHVRFNEAIAKVVGSGLSPEEIVGMPATSEGPAGLRFNAATAFRHAHEMLERAADIEARRKTFLWVSSGYDFNPFEDSRYRLEQERYGVRPQDGVPGVTVQDPFARQGQQFSEADLIAQIAELTRAARRANVVFYAVDPRGLLAGPDVSSSLSLEEYAEAAGTSLMSLHVLSEETGGVCLCNTNDFVGGLERIDRETSDYYIVGYNSTNPDLARVRRTIRIEVTRPGRYELDYRPEYTLDLARRAGGGETTRPGARSSDRRWRPGGPE